MSVDFIGVGSGKCGSSWLWQMMHLHPEIYSGNAKELNFFSATYPYFDKGIEWYERQFADAAPGQKCGEFSVTYMYDETALERIREYYPGIRLIMTVRDPVERAFSDYQHEIRKGLISADAKFQEFLDRGYQTNLGMFTLAIDRITKLFSEEQLLVVPLKAMQLSPETTLDAVYRHIGVSAGFRPDGIGQTVNKAFVPRSLAVERVITRGSRFLTMTGNVVLLEWLKRTGVVSKVRALNTSGKAMRMRADDEQKLNDLYATEKAFVRRLESEFGV